MINGSIGVPANVSFICFSLHLTTVIKTYLPTLQCYLYSDRDKFCLFEKKEMGTTLWCYRQRNARRSSLQENAKDRDVGLATSIVKFMKQSCMWTTKKKRKRILHLNLQEKKHELVTLEEWFLASPGLNISFTGEGDHHEFLEVSQQTSYGNRVHPSFDRNQEDCLTKSRENLNMERSSAKLVEEAREVVEYSSPCRRQSGKNKKKVSFRIPEVADIFILD